VFAARAGGRGWPWQDRWLLAVAFAIGVAWPLGGFIGVTLLPVVVVATPLVLRSGLPLRSAVPMTAPA
jgi:hypothetical protein